MRFVSSMGPLVVCVALAFGGGACASGDEAEGTSNDDFTGSQLYTQVRSIVTQYRNAAADTKKEKYITAEKLVYEAYGLSSLVAPEVRESLIELAEGSAQPTVAAWKKSPKISITSNQLAIAVSSDREFQNFVSNLSLKYVRVWLFSHGYGEEKYDQREFLTHDFEVLGGHSLLAHIIYGETSYDLSKIPRPTDSLRIFHAMQVVRYYGPRRKIWALSESDAKLYDAEFKACQDVYNGLSLLYHDDGTKR